MKVNIIIGSMKVYKMLPTLGKQELPLIGWNWKKESATKIFTLKTGIPATSDNQ